MNLKDAMVVCISAGARERVADLSRDLARSSSEHKEDILGEMEFQRWLAESCDDALRED